MSKAGKQKVSAARRQRAATAQETLRIVKEGSYVYNHNTVVIHEAVELAKTSTLLYESIPQCRPAEPRFDEPCCEMVVTNESTVSAIQHAYHDGNNNHIGCLNFASAMNPGGGFLNGSQAQEEALSRASALVPCLETQLQGYYKPNRANKSPMYLDLAIVSPLVPFFRDGQAETLLAQPILCTVITMPAPNARAQETRRRQDEIDQTLQRRAEIILRLAALQKIDVLILGAWGCGVFGNKPKKVAKIFFSLLQKEYRQYFRRVIFAVLDKTETQETFRAFSKVVLSGC